MAISQSALIQRATAYRSQLHESLRKSADAGALTSAFLCHSHKDEMLVKGLIEYFREEGIELYIDWQDNSMPETPNGETAKKIRDAIKSRPLFLFLASANAKASRWCPWEIGYADSSGRRVIIIPTSDGAGTYGNEYLQLYAHIDTGESGPRKGLAVFNAGSTGGQWLSAATLR